MKYTLYLLWTLIPFLSFAQYEKPNIVVLFCDDLGYGDLSCYGHPNIRTPHLDQMAQEGMRFTQFYSASPACTASRYGLLTGRLPIRSGFDWVLYPQSKRGLHKEEFTLAEALQAEGYATACFGKWHLGTTQSDFLPLQQGFEVYHGLPYSNDMIPPKWDPIPLMEGNDTLAVDPDQSLLTEAYTDRAISFMQSHQDQPFFLYLPYAMPHVPLHPGAAYAGKSSRGAYGDVVEEIDGSVGRILAEIRKLGMEKRTLVFFTSDNGPWIIKGTRGGSSGLLRDGKGSTWEGGQREPAIAWWPETIPAGKVCEEVASTLDVFPTAMALLDKSMPQDRKIDGRSMLPLFETQGKREETAFFYYGPGNVLDAVRLGSWKLHIRTTSQTGKDYFNGKLPLLFNLDLDPGENYDLSDEHPEVVAHLQELLADHKEEVTQTGTFFDQGE